MNALIANEIQLLLAPKEITQDIDTHINIASFDYYSGIRYCELMDIKQCTDFNKVNNGTGFVVCCGDVMVKVEPTDYPTITRRIF